MKNHDEEAFLAFCVSLTSLAERDWFLWKWSGELEVCECENDVQWMIS